MKMLIITKDLENSVNYVSTLTEIPHWVCTLLLLINKQTKHLYSAKFTNSLLIMIYNY